MICKKTWDKLWKCKTQDKILLWKVGVGALKTRGCLGRIIQCEDSKEFRVCYVGEPQKTHCTYSSIVKWRVKLGLSQYGPFS